jgi:hypothetical protein
MYASLLAVRALSSVYTQSSSFSERRWQPVQMGLTPSQRDLRSRQGSQARGILRRRLVRGAGLVDILPVVVEDG